MPTMYLRRSSSDRWSLQAWLTHTIAPIDRTALAGLDSSLIVTHLSTQSWPDKSTDTHSCLIDTAKCGQGWICNVTLQLHWLQGCQRS